MVSQLFRMRPGRMVLKIICPLQRKSCSKKIAKSINVIVWEFSFYLSGFRVHNQYGMVNSLWKTSPSSPPCKGGERGVVISSIGHGFSQIICKKFTEVKS